MKVGIIGLGLIGGSLGLDLRSLEYEVLGVSRRQATCDLAVAKGVVDQASINLDLISEANIIFICTPIGAIIPTLEQLLPYLNPETILTDVGSVKTSLVAKIESLWHNFVGGHPMAGTAESGIEAAQKHLFCDAPYVITPTEKTPLGAIKKVEEIARSLGSKIYFCSPSEHDRAVAWISHLPLMVSANLITSCMGETDKSVLDLAQKLASSGFRDTSRVGGGNPELGLMIAKNNRQELLQTLLQFNQNLELLIDLIEQENWQELNQFLNSTHISRPEFLQ